jgi:hypothetical protein
MTPQQALAIEENCNAVRRGSVSARYKVSGSLDVNHAETGVWFASEANAREYAQARSVTGDDTFDVTRGAKVLASFCNGFLV